ncbi:nuclear body protein SP140-like protein, partial [Tachysurus ichikawai]
CKSIQSQGHWFTPGEFVRFAGKGNGKRWKQSICCQNTPLQRLLEEGHLQSQKKCNVQKNPRIQLPVISLEVSSPQSVSNVETERSREDHEEERTPKQEEGSLFSHFV